MNRLRSPCVALAATFLLMASASSAPNAESRSRVHRFADPSTGFLVKFKPGVPEDQMAAHLAARGFAKAKRFQAPRKMPHAAIGRWWHVTLADPKHGRRLRRLKHDGLIERIEPNAAVKASGVPDDPQFPAHWGLHNIGQSGGIAGADVDAPEG